MFDRLYFPEKMVAILGVVIAVTGLIALGTGAGGMSEFLDSSSKSTIIALSVLTGFFALVVGVTSFLGGFLGMSPPMMGFISYVCAVVLMLFAWMAAGANAIASSALTTNTVKAALAFDILTGICTMVFLVGSVAAHRFHAESTHGDNDTR